jgi:hypothetical protein
MGGIRRAGGLWIEDLVMSKFGYVYVQTWTNPVAATAANVLAATALAVGATTVTTGLTNPDFPRNLSITGGAGGMAGNVVITGTNIRGTVITETIALSGTSTVVGNKAFATVTSVALPGYTNNTSDTVSVGVGVKLGLERELVADLVLGTSVNGTWETTRPTVAQSTSLIESNTLTTNTAPNGSKAIICAYITKEKSAAKRVTT